MSTNPPSSGSNVALVILVVAMFFMVLVGISSANANGRDRLRETLIADGYRCDEVLSVQRYGHRMIVDCKVMTYSKRYYVEYFGGKVFVRPAR